MSEWGNKSGKKAKSAETVCVEKDIRRARKKVKGTGKKGHWKGM